MTEPKTVVEGGPYRLHKAVQARPRRQHPTFEHAEAEARRLLALMPGETIVIMQEVARVSADGVDQKGCQ